MGLDISEIEGNEIRIENELHARYYEKVMNGEPLTRDDLKTELEIAREEFDSGCPPEDAINRALYETEEERLWRAFAEEPPTGRPDLLVSDDPEIWFPNYNTGEVGAAIFDRVIFNGKEYEKGLRYTSLHEVTEYKGLSRKTPLRGSSKYEIDGSGELTEKEKKIPSNVKETDLEISKEWLEWVENYGVPKYGLREDMLGTRAVLKAFETNSAPKVPRQLELYAEVIGNTADPEEPPKYTGRVKNPLWEFWAKHVHSKGAEELGLDPANEPEQWIDPKELQGIELPKIEKKRTYTIPRSKVRSKSAAFFQVKQSKKFMAFYTVSFPPGIPDDLAYRLFNTWLTRLRDKKKGVGLKSYLWVAERQEGAHKEAAIANLERKKKNALAKEGKSPAKRKKIEAFYDQKIRNWKPTHSIHFHLLTNNFMPIMAANHYMRAALNTMKKRGQYAFLEDFDPEKYNGVDVKHVGNNRQRLGYYLTKYITKNDTAIAHAVWRSSHDVSALFTEELTEDDKRHLMWQMIQERYLKEEGKKAPLYKVKGRHVDKTWIPPWVLARAAGLLTDTNQQIYDLHDVEKEGDMEAFLQNAYKQTPMWALWKEIQGLRKRKKARYRKKRMRAAMKTAKKKEFRELERTERRIVNNRIKKLIKWAKEEGFEL